MALALCALIPLLGGGALPFLNIKRRGMRMVYVEGVTLTASACVLFALIFSKPDTWEWFRLSDAFVCAFRVDGAGRAFVAISALLWPFAALYAAEYMRHERREGMFFAFYTMAYGVVILLAASANLFTMYIFYECLTLITLPLVEHGQDKAAFRAARAYMIYLIGGAALGFAAMVIASGAGAGDFALGGMFTGAETNAKALRIAYLCAFFGFGAKAAVFPLCFWLPKASVAPTPVTALLHAVAVVNAGVYAVMRSTYYVFGASLLSGGAARDIVLYFSAFTIAYGAVRAVREQHIKRRLAWSTVSNLGYMLFALSLMSAKGMAAALTHMAFHGLMKIVMFFCAGAILIMTGRARVRETRGLAKRMPFTFAAFLLAGLALAGVPPLCGFFSKYALFTSALEAPALPEILGCAALVLSSVLTAVYVFTIIIPAYFAPGDDMLSEARDPGAPIKISLAALCACVLVASALAGVLMNAFSSIAGA